MKTFAVMLFRAALPVLIATNLRAASNEDAEKLLDSGHADAAVDLMRKEVDKNVKDPYLLYNYALTLYRAGRFEEAINTFQGIDTAGDKNLQVRTALQLGNAQYRLAQKLQKPADRVGQILSMERALGYYQSANEIQPTLESKNNQKLATEQLVTTLLETATDARRHAQELDSKNDLPVEEHLLRDALQAYQRVRELDPGQRDIPQFQDETTKSLISDIERQGIQAGQIADEAQEDRIAQAKRQLSISKFDDALQLDPNNGQLTAEREDQVEKLSALLTDEAETLASPILAKPSVELTADDQSNLEQAKTKLDDALALYAANYRASELDQQVLKKLVESYVAEGNLALTTADAAPEVKDKLDQVKTAIDQFQKALGHDPQNQPALSGLQKAQAQLPDLYAAVGREDLAAAKALQPSGPWMPAKLSNPDLKTAIKLLTNSVEKLDTAVSLKPDNVSYLKSLAEAQAMLDAANLEADKRSPPPAPGGPPPPAAPRSEAGGKMLPLSLNDYGGAKPETESKFWNKKIRDW